MSPKVQFSLLFFLLVSILTIHVGASHSFSFTGNYDFNFDGGVETFISPLSLTGGTLLGNGALELLNSKKLKDKQVPNITILVSIK